MPINAKFLTYPQWVNVTNEQMPVLLTYLAQHEGMDSITMPKTPNTIIRAILSGGPAKKTTYLFHPEGTVEIVSREEWPDYEVDSGALDPNTGCGINIPGPTYDDDEQEEVRIDCHICGRSTLEDEYMHCPECEAEMCLYCYEKHVCPNREPSDLMPVDDLAQQVATIRSALIALFDPAVPIEEAADVILALLDNADAPDSDAALPPAQAKAMQQSRRFEALQRIRDAADYAEAKLIAREMQNPTTWYDANGEHHTLIGDPAIGPRLSGRAFQISEFEQEGQAILEAYGIPREAIEALKKKRSSVLGDLQGAIKRIVDNGGTPDEKAERLREAVRLAGEKNASRKLQRLYADHRWPLIPLARHDDGRDIHVEMIMPKNQWNGQVWSRLEAIVELSEVAQTVTPRGVLQVMRGERKLAWLFRLAVLAKGDLAAVLGVFEKSPDDWLDVAVDVSPLFMEYTEMRVKQIVNELTSLGILTEAGGKFQLNQEVWHVG